MNKFEVLKSFFGYDSFRPGQAEVIDSVCSGRDALAIMPTGAGKSICFQVPALVQSGVTIVVSPLISLMKDQVASLVQNGVSAAYINGSLSQNQISLVLSRISRKEYKIIYVAPERLLTPNFLSAVSNLEISIVCVDEAHCVSQWGHDFRTSYLDIETFVSRLQKRPVLCAVTATATKKVRQDIIRLIGLQDPFETVLSFDRPNLYFGIIAPKNKPKELRRLLKLYDGRSGIVYCSSRKRVDSLFESLKSEKFSVAKYHAGMSSSERKENQELFTSDERQIIIATNAFGMGIDKSNVSFVIHYNMPGDIESYYQEAGRAGRDGNSADCIMLFNKQDIRLQRYFIDNPDDDGQISFKEKERLRKLRNQKLEAMVGYTESKTCLRSYILSYFDEQAPEHCGNCSVCSKSNEALDMTIDAQKIMSCIARVKQSQSANVITDILKGNSSLLIFEKGYNRLSTYGIMKNTSNERLADEIRSLLLEKYIEEKNGCLCLLPKSKSVLKGREKVLLVRDKTKKSQKGSAFEKDEELFQKLRALRKDLAQQKGVPAFVVFSDATLYAMSSIKPESLKEFLCVPGVGERKLHDYGTIFVKEICAYLSQSKD